MTIKVIGYVDTEEVIKFMKETGVSPHDVEFVPSYTTPEFLLNIQTTILQIKFLAFYLVRIFGL